MPNKALVVVDAQNDFIYGPLSTRESPVIIPRIKSLIKFYEDHGFMVVFTQDDHGTDYLNTHEGQWLPVPHCLSGSEGWKIVDGLNDGNHEVFTKSTFGYTLWQDTCIAKADCIELVGVCTDICVIANALMLRSLYPEKEIGVDAMCCAGTTPEKHRAALEVMMSCHIDVNNYD